MAERREAIIQFYFLINTGLPVRIQTEGTDRRIGRTVIVERERRLSEHSR